MYSGKKDLLTKAKDLLKQELTSISYTTWIKSLEIKSLNDNKIVLIAKSTFQKEAIETRYADLIMNTFNFITNKNCEITVIEEKDLENENNNIEENSNEDSSLEYTKTENYQKTFLNPKYTFDNFVVGENNRFAHAAALAVSEAPGTAYNPLFLYGGVGLGKTHLMHSIGNEILRQNRNFNVLYVTSEKFTNEFINGIRDGSNEKFRQKYRNIDVLLIDDIQFIAGKEGIQEEFFHTFNTICENKGQIVLTSDKPPKDINPLEERLKSRFGWGLSVDISVANYETRLAILRKKVELENIVIDDLVLSNIATKVDSNIRELEGTLTKIVAQASLTHSPITYEIAEKAISDVIAHREKVISSDYIKETVSKFFNIDVEDMNSSKRSNMIAYPRQIAMYLCRELAKMQYKNIGNAFGKRDHSTVMHACNKIEQEIKEKNKTTINYVDCVKNIILKPQN